MALKFHVPSGIGDYSAMHSKLAAIGRQREIIIEPTQDSPNRLLPLLQILPDVKCEGYGAFGTGITLTHTLPPGTDLASLEDGNYFLSCNQWLEEGNPISDWIPGPTEYHYRINITPDMVHKAWHFMSHHVYRPIVGVYTSAYGNSRHWGFWGPDEWYTFLSRVREHMPRETVFLFIGAEYDLDISNKVYERMMNQNADLGTSYWHALYAVGGFHIGETIELIRLMDYFFSFPSGLGFLADVVSTPHTMWFPANLDRMRYTFCDPQNKLKEITVHALFHHPKELADSFLNNHLHVFQEKAGGRIHG